MPSVRLTSGEVIPVPQGSSLLEALHGAGVFLTAACGGVGTCGKCRVRVLSGEVSPPTPAERLHLAGEVADGLRLACQIAPLTETVELEIPRTSRAPEMRILEGGAPRSVPFLPNVKHRPFLWKRPGLKTPGSVFDQICRAIQARTDLKPDRAVLGVLAGGLEPEREYQATMVGDRLVAVEPVGPARRWLGAAVDVGTTTVVVQLLDLETGKRLATASAPNAQSRYGANVVTRIERALSDPEGLFQLQRSVRETVGRLIRQAAAEAGASPEEVYEVVLVGNTAMLHLYAGVSPRTLGEMPYLPAFRELPPLSAEESGLPIHPRGQAVLLPIVAGYVGADAVGAMLAAGFDEPFEGVRILADIGTNCEIVLQRGEEILVCSTPAGPAFEGGELSTGMAAGPGAVERVRLGEKVQVRTIGGAPPQGICGSGAIDLVAELVRLGIVDLSGRFQPRESLQGVLPEAVLSGLHDRPEPAFWIARRQDGRPVGLTQKDVRELQLAKAAVRVGVEMLLESLELRAEQVDQLLIAGAFGNYLSRENAVRIGMFPKIPLERIRYIGNAAIVGAQLALISTEMRQRAQQLARRAEHLQIATHPEFQMRFAEAMFFGDAVF